MPYKRPHKKAITLKYHLLLVLSLVVLVLGCQKTSNVKIDQSQSEIANFYSLIYLMRDKDVINTPCPFLVHLLSNMPDPPIGATALDIGSGSGRNSIYLARKGYAVTAVDISRVGLDLTKKTAKSHHLPITTIEQDINSFDIGKNNWNLIVLIDFPFPYQELLPRIAEGLKPDGIVIINGVSVKQGGKASALVGYTLMDRKDITKAFGGFTIIHDSENLQDTIWGGKKESIIYAAQKGR
jgi:2-polyprenyl-3-methyl-5-hydroxy-6-metoxy-1,4-benzoquinol methylase